MRENNGKNGEVREGEKKEYTKKKENDVHYENESIVNGKDYRNHR